MSPRLASVLAVIAALALPLVLIGNTLWLLANPWLVDLEYALPGFPGVYAEGPELSDELREELADAGIESIRPFGDDVEVLRDADLANGGPAFSLREITHMQDVRDLIGAILRAWAIVLALALAACAWLARGAGAAAVWRALVRGSLLTVAAMGLVGILMLIDFEFFFDSLHGPFFEGESWEFNETYVLRSLYPYFFWGVAGGMLAALVVLQAAALLLAARRAGAEMPWLVAAERHRIASGHKERSGDGER
ncbi:MAG: DUF1461 domain-containing protein [Actinobacteria bacterium]|nr:DUF1461 domain-containing protein [Actinomycetota bacterium]